MIQRKKQMKRRRAIQASDSFDKLPDDVLLLILCKLSSSSSCPSDFINVLITCKRMDRLGRHPIVLSKAGAKTLTIKANNWSDLAHRFLTRCANAGNTEACYILGMIQFYCLQDRHNGVSLIAKAAIQPHATALHSLAVIQFNGSGASKTDKDLPAGVALCARAALYGHIGALRELGHCLQDGYGVAQNIAKGRRLLIQANVKELALSWKHQQCETAGNMRCLSLEEFGCELPAPDIHPVNHFLKEWFELDKNVLGNGLKLCTYDGCGRPETRPLEFRGCSICGSVNYCSRGCQAVDWKIRHKDECALIRWNGGDRRIVREEDIALL